MIVYLGQYISEKVHESRGLPSLNVAGTNRMQRVAEALFDAGAVCWILAPGAAARLRWKRCLIHPERVERRNRVPVLFASALGVPFLSVLWTPAALLWALFLLNRRVGVDGIVVYNFHFLDCVVAFIGRFIFRVPVLLDLEDVSVPRWSDWRRDSETSAFQQLRLWPLMKTAIHICHAVFAPTRRFQEVVPKGKPFKVISGCMRVPLQAAAGHSAPAEPVSEECPLVFLFAGKIEFEHGVDVLAEAIRILDGMPVGKRVVFHICGGGRELPWLRDALASMQRVRVSIHGFLSNQAFAEIFEKAEACIVLQRPKGRHAQYKTPSKGYEAMCAGKALLVSEIGDFGELPDEVCAKVVPFSSQQLAALIAGLKRERVRQYARNAAAYARGNWNASTCGERLLALMADVRKEQGVARGARAGTACVRPRQGGDLNE